MTTGESVPRFIRTQGGEFVAVDKISRLRVWTGTQSSFIAADIDSDWDVTLGTYDSKADADAALRVIVQVITNGVHDVIEAPARDFRAPKGGRE